MIYKQSKMIERTVPIIKLKLEVERDKFKPFDKLLLKWYIRGRSTFT
jgi:hypothetical protein